MYFIINRFIPLQNIEICSTLGYGDAIIICSPSSVTHMEIAVPYTLKYSRISYFMKQRIDKPGPSHAW